MVVYDGYVIMSSGDLEHTIASAMPNGVKMSKWKYRDIYQLCAFPFNLFKIRFYTSISPGIAGVVLFDSKEIAAEWYDELLMY